MANHAYAILSSINESIIRDDLDRVSQAIAPLLANLSYGTDIGKQILRTAVGHHCYNIVNYMFYNYPWLLTKNKPFKMELFHFAISYCNAYVVELLLQNVIQFGSDIESYYYDQLIDHAYQNLEELRRISVPNNQDGNITRLKQIMKRLLEFPYNRYNEHGIILKYDEATFDFTVSRNDNLDFNRLINGKTVLEIWTIREHEIDLNRSQTSWFIQKIISDIIKYLIKHVAVMKTLDVFVSQNNLQAINSKSYYLCFKTLCHSEIKRMSEVGITTDKFVSMFDILTAGKDSLAEYIKNHDIWNFVFSESFVKDFPFYGKNIVNSLKASYNEQVSHSRMDQYYYPKYLSL